MSTEEQKELDQLAKAIINHPTVNERPEGMSYLAYRIIRAHQTRMRRAKFSQKPSRKIAQMMPIRVGYNWHSFIMPPEPVTLKEKK